MRLDITREVAAMERMTVGQLQEQYAEVFGEQPRSRHKAWLIRRIAWRLQAQAEGDLSERARRRAEELADDADVRVTPPKSVVIPVRSHSTPEGRSADPRLPARRSPGSTKAARWRSASWQTGSSTRASGSNRSPPSPRRSQART